MNVEIFKRNIKLQELGIGKLSSVEQKILDFLNENLTDLNAYTTNNYLNYLFFGKNKENIVLEYNKESGYLYVSCDRIWSFFESEFDIKDIDIQMVIGWYLGNTLNLKVNHIYGINGINGIKLVIL